MTVAIAHSTNPDPARAATEIKSALSDISPTAVLFFASPSIGPDELAGHMDAAFPSATVFGCTTAGELISGMMLKGSCVAMAFDAEHVPDVCVAVVEGLSKGPNAGPAFAAFEQHFGLRPAEMSASEYVGIVLADGMSGAEEALMETIGNRTDVLFVGGSAGDDLAFDTTWVFAGGKAYSDAAVLALIKPGTPFEIIKTQSFCVSDRTLVATRADEKTRTVIEFDGRPAAEAYADALGVSAEEVASQFMSHPVGLVIDGEPYVRSPQRVLEDGSIRFYCKIGEGMRMTVLDATDIITETADALADAGQKHGSLSAIVNFNCILRTLELEHEGKTASYAALFADTPTVGFSTYGECYLGHINQTATMLVFGTA